MHSSDVSLVRDNYDCHMKFDDNIIKEFVKNFETWNDAGQNEFVENLLSKMSHYQHSQINIFLKPMLQRDFISLLPSNLFY